VLPRFADQIAKNKPLTVTHTDASRYFLSGGEAADLVLASAWLGVGADILVPDLGEPVRIVDLAREMIAASRVDPDESLGIVFTGLGPGEKLSEELLGSDERALAIDGCDIRRVVEGGPWSGIERYVAALDELSGGDDTGALMGMVREIVPEYQPSRQVVGAAGLAEEETEKLSKQCR
jgi:FlaA1/EpsC-like NDP-sugar epimerase